MCACGRRFAQESEWFLHSLVEAQGLRVIEYSCGGASPDHKFRYPAYALLVDPKAQECVVNVRGTQVPVPIVGLKQQAASVVAFGGLCLLGLCFGVGWCITRWIARGRFQNSVGQTRILVIFGKSRSRNGRISPLQLTLILLDSEQDREHDVLIDMNMGTEALGDGSARFHGQVHRGMFRG